MWAKINFTMALFLRTNFQLYCFPFLHVQDFFWAKGIRTNYRLDRKVKQHIKNMTHFQVIIVRLRSGNCIVDTFKQLEHWSLEVCWFYLDY